MAYREQLPTPEEKKEPSEILKEARNEIISINDRLTEIELILDGLERDYRDTTAAKNSTEEIVKTAKQLQLERKSLKNQKDAIEEAAKRTIQQK